MLWDLLSFAPPCPICGSSVRRHQRRTLARERWSSGLSGVESHLVNNDFAKAAALDDATVLGDQLVHQLIRCGAKTALVTTEDPIGLGREARVRRLTILEDPDADAAWRCAR